MTETCTQRHADCQPCIARFADAGGAGGRPQQRNACRNWSVPPLSGAATDDNPSEKETLVD
ncbi:MAG: hypothetical protein ACT6T0_08745 [Nevskia sp.]|uniref:hypothetical protein n=1 Tax=Nevskia sp. TaxID=1929292 RepID=UPI004036578F